MEPEAHDEMIHHSVMFAPKSIVLVSQLNYFDTFKVGVLSLKPERFYILYDLLSNLSDNLIS